MSDCEEINECDDSYFCHDNDIGASKDDSHTCVCYLDYQGDGFNCADVDECDVSSTLDRNCYINSIYNNNDRSFTCTCKKGFTQVKSYGFCKIFMNVLMQVSKIVMKMDFVKIPRVRTSVYVSLVGQVMVQVALTSMIVMSMQTNLSWKQHVSKIMAHTIANVTLVSLVKMVLVEFLTITMNAPLMAHKSVVVMLDMAVMELPVSIRMNV